MQEIQGKVAVIGVGYANPTRNPVWPLGVDTLEACRKAIADAGLQVADIDGVGTWAEQPYGNAGSLDGLHMVTPSYVVHGLNLPNVGWEGRGNGFIGTAFIEAANAVFAGVCKYALVWRALTFPGHGGPGGTGQRYGQTAPDRASGNNQFMYPYGYTGPGPASRAVIYRRYMEKYGATREHMATFIVNNRKNALMNEKSYWYNFQPQPLTVEDYLTARMVTDPYCLYDCDIPVHGCAVWVLTSSERATAAPHNPAYVFGCVPGVYGLDPTLGPLDEFQEVRRRVGNRLWELTGLSPKDINTANLYDGFSSTVYLWLEGMGFCGEGEAYQFIQDGRIELDGELPLNTSGGSLGEGRLHGGAHITEAILQTMGRAGPRQVKDAFLNLAVVGTPGGAIVFSREPS